MLTLKELENRIYKGRQCIGFDYTVKAEKDIPLEIRFRKCADENERDTAWRLQVVLDKTNYSDSQVYTITYAMPLTSPPLTLVAATGLRYLQMHLESEIQSKVNYDFIIGEIISGM